MRLKKCVEVTQTYFGSTFLTVVTFYFLNPYTVFDYLFHEKGNLEIVKSPALFKFSFCRLIK